MIVSHILLPKIDKNWGIRVPGYGDDTPMKVLEKKMESTTEIHNLRVDAVRKAQQTKTNSENQN
jgi:hypothetical protein